VDDNTITSLEQELLLANIALEKTYLTLVGAREKYCVTNGARNLAWQDVYTSNMLDTTVRNGVESEMTRSLRSVLVGARGHDDIAYEGIIEAEGTYFAAVKICDKIYNTLQARRSINKIS
jgi:hypothetical protein